MPTPTLTPAPTATPKPDLYAGLGDALYDEQFLPGADWELGEDASGGTNLTESGLVLAVREPYALRFAHSPSPDLDDFLLEVSLRVDICSGADSFGVAFRITPNGDHYRFTLTCAGQASFMRSRAGNLVTLTASTQTNSAMLGAPSSNHLTILALNDTFHFFINDVEVFSQRDRGLGSGGLGVFVQAGQAGQTTVTFQHMLALEVIPNSVP
ncbi:MAG: hypothetical protein PVJ32_05010 [Anaerolineales bacterium]|jgi:hypothetical protein